MVRQAENPESDEIVVKVAVLGGETQAVILTPESTVEDALEEAGVSTSESVKCNGEAVNLHDIVEDGDRLIVTSNVKGGTL